MKIIPKIGISRKLKKSLKTRNHTIAFVGIMVAVISSVVIGMAHNKSTEAAAGCSTHQVAITDWGIVQGAPDFVNVSYNTKCGGTTSNYRVVFNLQVSLHSVWSHEVCANGALCTVYRPGKTSFFTSGTRHGCLNYGCGPDITWHPNSSINGVWYRVQMVVHFANGNPNLTYYSNERKL